jgi:hypothetical protein
VVANVAISGEIVPPQAMNAVHCSLTERITLVSRIASPAA